MTDYTKYRILEVLPGLSVWLTLIVALVLSFVRPLWMIYAVILFDIYWMLRVINFSFYLILSWLRFREVRSVDWKDSMRHDLSNWQDKQHVIFLTLYEEEWDVVETAIQSIRAAAYDKTKCTIVIAGEQRAHANYKEILSRAHSAFDSDFADIVGTLHPEGLENEIPGKGSNLHYAEERMKEYIEKKGWNPDHVIATVFDVDTICHPQYFAYLTYLYCTHPNPTRSSFQPIALFNNNIWDSPAILRVMSFGTTFWIFTALARQDALVTFSSHSMSWRALLDVGFHEKRIVSEDSRIFYQCLLHYDGDYEVTPMYLPVSMDTVRDDSWWVSIKNLYKQQRRWAWGVEHVPYLLWEFKKKGRRIPFFTKFKWVFLEWEGKWSWSLVAILITVLGQLPILAANESVRQSALFINTPHLLQTLMTVATLGLLLSALFSFPLLPSRPESHPRHKYIIMLLQWVLLPISLIFISAIPAIDAVTHLMLGKYLGFNVSQKKRKQDVVSSGVIT
ncbi:MAG: hypothetical protein COU35_02185 [Candidatus Magasanikbacteria bacterium CG10_big_fil_rev_8_21_14_0_10_47_10]|uniref:Glycosyltransferase 2-like domain-containing protein n=1 Tax=Candidatus Magasanikbacteria bacterium CG10_big_fil_rev_8_21_14_0_10_47_10 TaxID=1974652 RepID=A0A2H0TQN9_9BACT|nr:MAG: hypothetical protein COU35_02185 [Candidatus Magasanikbacteria bacterium CG10_big_fil_rev_8_21_14_0_10_47_10]